MSQLPSNIDKSNNNQTAIETHLSAWAIREPLRKKPKGPSFRSMLHPGMLLVSKSKNSPHTPTFSILVSPCTYYFYHFSCTSSDSIIDIPPLRNLHNHFLCAIPFITTFYLLSRFFGEIR